MLSHIMSLTLSFSAKMIFFKFVIHLHIIAKPVTLLLVVIESYMYTHAHTHTHTHTYIYTAKKQYQVTCLTSLL